MAAISSAAAKKASGIPVSRGAAVTPSPTLPLPPSAVSAAGNTDQQQQLWRLPSAKPGPLAPAASTPASLSPATPAVASSSASSTASRSPPSGATASDSASPTASMMADIERSKNRQRDDEIMMLHSDLFDAELKYMQEREAREKAEARLATIEALRDDEQAAYLHELRGLATRVRQQHARTEQQQATIRRLQEGGALAPAASRAAAEGVDAQTRRRRRVRPSSRRASRPRPRRVRPRSKRRPSPL